MGGVEGPPISAGSGAERRSTSHKWNRNRPWRAPTIQRGISEYLIAFHVVAAIELSDSPIENPLILEILRLRP